MGLPVFYLEQLQSQQVVLDEDTSKHVISVLRMQAGERILLTDGKGNRSEAVIMDANRKRCQVEITFAEKVPPAAVSVTIGISVMKNTSRFEWFLEKATEIGVQNVIPLICNRTEKEKFRYDRMRSILISAMLQSQQAWLPVLNEPVPFTRAIQLCSQNERFIAHCIPSAKQSLAALLVQERQIPAGQSRCIFIGPEGDFTPEEAGEAVSAGFLAVSLGETRLRTETAGMVAAVLLKQLPAATSVGF